MTPNQHVLEETLEALVIGRLQITESDRVEDHLLVCEKCRLRFEEVEEFVHAARSAAAQIRQREISEGHKPPFRVRISAALMARPVWATAGAFAILAIVTLPAFLARESVAYRDLALTTVRGNDTVALSGSVVRLRLKLDLRELPAVHAVRVSVVDAQGSPVFDTEVPAEQAVSPGVEIKKRLPPGTYWVRLMVPGEHGKLLREYPLHLE